MHKVIFIHIPKTGGQSIEQMFLDDLGLSWEDRAPLLLRPNRDRTLGPNRLAHLYADEYVSRGHISQEDFDSYFKFAVVRDPYARIVSEYLYRIQNRPWYRQPPSWLFVRRENQDDFYDTPRHMMPQTRYVMDGQGKLLVDRIIRFENMGPAMEDLSEQFFGERRSLPHRNKTESSARTKARKARVQRFTKGPVARRYKMDFEAFDYPL